jgi:hypothetical protein
MDTVALPPERCRLFLAVRCGVPLVLAAVFLGLALVSRAAHGWEHGWLLLGAMAALGEVWPAFQRGRTIIRRDVRWAWGLRPVFRALGLEEVWLRSFCAWNNLRVRSVFQQRRSRRTLVLLPHCIQMARCKAEILKDLSKCYECGLCSVGDILPLQIARGWETRISNRSHKAYREARAYRPDLIVAVSCVDRLFKGVMKMKEVPCYLIPLELPHRMCVDTTFSVPHLMAAMETLAEPRPAGDGKVQPLRREGIA